MKFIAYSVSIFSMATQFHFGTATVPPSPGGGEPDERHLNEGTNWFLGNKGMTCIDTCIAAGKVCDQTSVEEMNAVDDETKVEAVADNFASVSCYYGSSVYCGPVPGASPFIANEICYYNTVASSTCNAASTGQRFCWCSELPSQGPGPDIRDICFAYLDEIFDLFLFSRAKEEAIKTLVCGVE